MSQTNKSFDLTLTAGGHTGFIPSDVLQSSGKANGYVPPIKIETKDMFYVLDALHSGIVSNDEDINSPKVSTPVSPLPQGA